ncbi:MAG: Fe-S cluster assembly protein SufD [Ardenticatenia bacterium]|nr:MAG: Fe-S cluster assembly protein SufD [Ardenticatenia bacterium]
MEDETVTEKTLAFEALSREAVEALSARFGEPDWLRQRRLDAWRLFLDTPWPSNQKDEEWRKIDTDLLVKTVQSLHLVSPESEAVAATTELPEKLQGILREADRRSALLVRREGGLVFADVNDDLREQGVIVADLLTAVREHGDLLEPYLAQIVRADEGKFKALHTALLSGGFVVFVPKNVALAKPIQLVHWLDEAGTLVFPHVLVVAEANSAVTVLDEYLSNDLPGVSFVTGTVEILAGDNAQVNYLNVQNWGNNVYHLASQRARMGRNTVVNWSSGQLGGSLTRFETEVWLEGDGGMAYLNGIYFPTGEQYMANHTLQRHIATHCSSDLLYKGALLGNAHTVYRGLIKVEKGAQQTDAYQANRNLVLSPQAHADSIPMLEIEANDVRCTHGATISQLDEEELFYLMARGIPRKEATNLIVDGFFAPVIDRIPLRTVRDRLKTVIHERMENA